jgi:DNA polymerase III subunit delta
MRPSSLASVYKNLRDGEIALVYYLTGDVELLKDEVVSAIVAAALEPGARDFNLDVRSAGEVDASGLQSLVETVPVFAARRVVVIRNLEQWRKNAKPWEALRRYLENPSSSTVLVLVHGAGESANASLAQAGVHVEVAVPNPEALRQWVTRRAEGLALHLTADGVDHLVHAVGADLGHLASELDKLAAALGTEHAVGAEEVARLVGVNPGETVEDWVGAILGRDLRRALRLTDVVLPQAGVTGVRMVMTLGTGLVGVRLARALAEGGLSGARLERAVLAELGKARPQGVRDWGAQARSWCAAARRWSAADLDRALAAAYAADRSLKSTTLGDDRDIVRTLVLSLGAQEAAA